LNVVLAEEVRDQASWQAVADACAEGVRVISTTHAFSVPSVKSVLIDCGASEGQLCRFLRGISVQMLVNRFSQDPADRMPWPLTTLSEYALFFDEAQVSAEWDTLVSQQHDLVNKLLRGMVGENAVNKNLQQLKRQPEVTTYAEVLADRGLF
jgi:type II secretory ATPase GspE/PulE/Tfp pilus assembly ATPase PilB-like protein